MLGLVLLLDLSPRLIRAEEAGAVVERRVFPEAGPSGADAGPLFLPISADLSGIDFVIPIDLEHPDRRLYYSAMACGGVAVGDLNGDGWPELFFSAGPVANRLYRHLGEGGTPRFAEMAAAAGVAEAESWCNGAAMADVDSDGDLDLFICRYDEPNRLYLNESKSSS